jgi:hypothetical protein
MLKKIFVSLALAGSFLNVQAQTTCDRCAARTEFGGRSKWIMSCIHPDEKAMCDIVKIESYTFSRFRKKRGIAEAPISLEMFSDALGSGQGLYLLTGSQKGDVLSISHIKAINTAGDLVEIKGFALKITEKNPLPVANRLKNRWIELPNILPEMKDLDKSKIQITSFLVNGEEFKTAGFDANLISDDANISKVKATYMGKPLPVADFVWKWE